MAKFKMRESRTNPFAYNYLIERCLFQDWKLDHKLGFIMVFLRQPFEEISMKD